MLDKVTLLDLCTLYIRNLAANLLKLVFNNYKFQANLHSSTVYVCVLLHAAGCILNAQNVMQSVKDRKFTSTFIYPVVVC